MKLPPKVKEKYLARLDELIQKGGQIPIHNKPIRSGGNYLTGESSYIQIKKVEWSKFVEWRTSCITILEQVIRGNSVHRSTVESFHNLKNDPGQVEFGISFLRSLREDIDKDYLQSLTSEIEAEITADYMGQAENLLKEGTRGKYDHVPAAVLAGAVLEKSLKTICSQLSPPEPIFGEKGSHLKLNALIDALKKRSVYNEVTAKQLRSWADIRNHAGHGNFEEFNRGQVELMISGINTFLMQYI